MNNGILKKDYTRKDWCLLLGLDYIKFKNVPVGAFHPYHFLVSDSFLSKKEAHEIAGKVENSVVICHDAEDADYELCQVFVKETKSNTIARLTKTADEIERYQFFKPKINLEVEFEVEKDKPAAVLLMSSGEGGLFNGCHFIARDEVNNVSIVGNDVFVKNGTEWQKR